MKKYPACKELSDFQCDYFQNMYLPPMHLWKGGQIHKDDILTIDFCQPNLLCTASFDGEIIVWDVETEKIFVRLRKGQASNMYVYNVWLYSRFH